MPTVLSMLDEKTFDAEARIDGRPCEVGDVWNVSSHASRSPNVKKWLSEGGTLGIVVKRPPVEVTGPWGPRPRLWLVGVLQSPVFQGRTCTAEPNTAPIVDLSDCVEGLSFAPHGIRYKLDDVFRSPQLLTDPDESVLAQLLGGSPHDTARHASEASHALLEQWLADRRSPSKDKSPDLATLLALPEPERAALGVDLVVMRRTSTCHNDNYFHVQQAWRELFASVTDVSLPLLCALLQEIGRTGPLLCGFPWGFAWERAQAWMTVNGTTPELVDSLRAMQASMHVHQSDKNAALEIDRELWFETHMPIDPSSCASSVVKRTLCAMTPVQRQSWSKLLHHAMEGTQAEPRKTWLVQAQRHLKRVGQDELAKHLAGWLGEIVALEPCRVSKSGADILRGLLWYAGQVRSREQDELIERLACKTFPKGKHWSTRHDRFIGAIVWYLGVAQSPAARRLILLLRNAHGKAIEKAVESALARPASGSL